MIGVDRLFFSVINPECLILRPGEQTNMVVFTHSTDEKGCGGILFSVGYGSWTSDNEPSRGCIIFMWSMRIYNKEL